MYGIAGVMLSEPGPIGSNLMETLDSCQHRGPDSTGFALYKDPYRDRLVPRVYLGVQEASPKASEPILVLTQWRALQYKIGFKNKGIN